MWMEDIEVEIGVLKVGVRIGRATAFLIREAIGPCACVSSAHSIRVGGRSASEPHSHLQEGLILAFLGILLGPKEAHVLQEVRQSRQVIRIARVAHIDVHSRRSL